MVESAYPLKNQLVNEIRMKTWKHHEECYMKSYITFDIGSATCAIFQKHKVNKNFNVE